MKELRHQILDYVKSNGPVLPVQISKGLNGSIIFAGAFLSELVASKLVKYTSAKVGGSPLYYVDGQEDKLQSLRDHLSERPGKAFDLLKDRQVLRDKVCEPWERVALREIKDFAFPLNVTIKDNTELFWKWYLLSDVKATELIHSMVSGELAVKEEPLKIEEVKGDAREKVKPEAVAEPVIDVPVEEKPKKPRKRKAEAALSVHEGVSAVIAKEDIKIAHTEEFKALDDQGEFYREVIKFFSDKDIRILSQKVKAKSKEFSFVVKVPSLVGSLKYLVIARSKKKLSDSDLALAYHEGMDHKMPVLVLGAGEITKKAEHYIETNVKGLVFKKIP